MLKMVTTSLTFFSRIITKVLGSDLLQDVSTFVAAMDSMFGGFRERADKTYRLLKTPGTRFLVVASPEPDAVREAAYFAERLTEDEMPLAGLILNRVHTTGAPELTAERALAAAQMLDDSGASPVTAEALRVHATLVQQVARERRYSDRFVSAHPSVPVARVPAQAEDVHDLGGLRDIGAALARAEGDPVDGAGASVVAAP
jgi:anion-transporting  ArsA/GET3 family ATPase